MLDFNLERFKRLPLQPGVIWQGGLFRMPAWVTGEGKKPFRPLMALWANPNEPRISQPQFVQDDDPHEVAMEALVKFGHEAGRKAHRPFAIEVTGSDLAAFLEQRLQGSGVRIDCVPELPGMRHVLDDLSEHMDKRKEPPGALSGKGVGIEQVRAYAEAAAKFYQARLWDELSDDDLLEITQPAPPPGMRYVSVLGHGGQTFGLGFFGSLEEYEKMYDTSSPGRFFARNGVWSMTFGDITELPFADADLWEDYGLPVAGPEAYPCAWWFGPKKQMRRPGAHELAFIEGLLRALAETTGANMDAGGWSRTVTVGGKDVEFRLSLVNEVEEPSEKSRRPETPVNPQYLRRAMEKNMANLERILAEHEFESIEEANAFIQANLNRDEPLEAAPRTPLEQAQEVMYDAWEAKGRRRRMLARKALEICDDCADAYVLLAEDNSDPAKACELYRQGMAAGERAIGADVFESEAGQFWGALETRPYMRARFGLAQTLWDMGERAEAVSHYEELLRLNPNDNQGVRYLLAACLLELGDDDKLGKLLDAYGEDGTAQWQYLQALSCYRREGDTAKARKLAKGAIKNNRYVPDYLTGRRRLPERMPETFRLGHEDEAVCCASELRAGWKATPGAVEWLKQFKPGH